ncbi:MAG: sigma-70 family RNA polymerase sigma factor [Clostridia bacterium]|nr:sigma-70 family RNA polymerase sigma factor [Clostridia bacterium]
MFTREESQPTRDQEYQALRQFLRLADSSDSESMAQKIAGAVENELTPRQRELVHLYYIDQMTMYDIAIKSGVSVSTVSRTLKRARERLKKFLRYGGRMLLDKIEE